MEQRPIKLQTTPREREREKKVVVLFWISKIFGGSSKFEAMIDNRWKKKTKDKYRKKVGRGSGKA